MRLKTSELRALVQLDFAEELRHQHLSERKEFIDEIKVWHHGGGL